MNATRPSPTVAMPPIVAPAMAPLETVRLGPRYGATVFAGIVGVALAAIVTMLAAEVGTAVVKFSVIVAILVDFVELLDIAVVLVVRAQVLAGRSGSCVLSTKYAL